MTHMSDEMRLAIFQPESLQEESTTRRKDTEELIRNAEAHLHLQVRQGKIDRFTDRDLLEVIRQIDREDRKGNGIHRTTLWRVRQRQTADLAEAVMDLGGSHFVEHDSKTWRTRRVARLRRMDHRTLAIRLVGLDALEQYCIRRQEWLEQMRTQVGSAPSDQADIEPTFSPGTEIEQRFRNIVGTYSRNTFARKIVVLEHRIAALQAHLWNLDVQLLDSLNRQS